MSSMAPGCRIVVERNRLLNECEAKDKRDAGNRLQGERLARSPARAPTPSYFPLQSSTSANFLLTKIKQRPSQCTHHRPPARHWQTSRKVQAKNTWSSNKTTPKRSARREVQHRQARFSFKRLAYITGRTSTAVWRQLKTRLTKKMSKQ